MDHWGHEEKVKMTESCLLRWNLCKILTSPKWSKTLYQIYTWQKCIISIIMLSKGIHLNFVCVLPSCGATSAHCRVCNLKLLSGQPAPAIIALLSVFSKKETKLQRPDHKRRGTFQPSGTTAASSSDGTPASCEFLTAKSAPVTSAWITVLCLLSHCVMLYKWTKVTPNTQTGLSSDPSLPLTSTVTLNLKVSQERLTFDNICCCQSKHFYWKCVVFHASSLHFLIGF